MKRLTKLFFAILAICPVITETRAQKRSVDFSAGADIVSTYVWRGTQLASASVQPSMNISYGGLSLGAWGNVDFDGTYKEVDISLNYSFHGFSVGLTDYYASTASTYFGKYKENHLLEANLSYSFGESFPLYISWNTFFLGDLDLNTNGDHAYSSYIEVGYDFQIEDIGLTAAVGVAPWEAPAWLPMNKKGFKVSNISLMATKEVDITDRYSLPLFAGLIANPAYKNMNLVFGVSF